MKLVNGPSEYTGPTRPVDFIRHGSTSMNSHGKDDDKIRGWLNAPLDDRGIKEARDVGKKLCSGPRPHVLATSDLKRAADTAHIISQICGIPVRAVTAGLRPWNLGHFQGQESKVVHSQLLHYFDNPRARVPGGESYAEFQARFFGALKEILQRLPGRIGLVSHHRNERLLAASEKANWQGIDRGEFGKQGNAPGIMTTFNVPVGR